MADPWVDAAQEMKSAAVPPSAVSSPPTTDDSWKIWQPQSQNNGSLMSRIGSQVGDFFSTAAHAMNPENAMAMIPTNMEDLKNKAGDEWQNIKSHVAGAGQQFGQGNIGAGVSTLMHGVPVIGPATGQSAEDLRQGNVGKAAGEIAPFFIPGMPDAASAAGRGISGATTKGLDWAANAAEPISLKAAEMINAHPAIAKGVIGTSAAVPVYLAAHGLSHDVGLSGLGSLYAARGAAKHFGNAAVDWARNHPGVERPAPRPQPGYSPSQSGIGIPTGEVYTGTTGISRPGAFTGTVGTPSPSPTPAPPVPSGPTPQFLDQVAKAVGGKNFASATPGQVQAVETILKDMEAQGKAPYPGTYTPTQPSPVSAPATPIPEPAAAPQATVRPPDGPVVSDTWTDKAGNQYPIQMISPDQLQAHAQKYSQPIAASRAEIESQGITIPDTKTIRNSLVYRAKRMGVSEDQLKQIAQNDYQREGIGDMTSTELMDAYGNMLKREGPFSEQHHADVLHNKQTNKQILPMQPASGTSLTNVTPFGWPQP